MTQKQQALNEAREEFIDFTNYAYLCEQWGNKDRAVMLREVADDVLHVRLLKIERLKAA